MAGLGIVRQHHQALATRFSQGDSNAPALNAALGAAGRIFDDYPTPKLLVCSTVATICKSLATLTVLLVILRILTIRVIQLEYTFPPYLRLVWPVLRSHAVDSRPDMAEWPRRRWRMNNEGLVFTVLLDGKNGSGEELRHERLS